MKKFLLAAACVLFCMARLSAQEPNVNIKINNEERFRFENSRISFINPLNNIFIGDTAGSFGSEAHDNIAIGKFAGAHPGRSYDNIFIGGYAGSSDTSGFNNIYIGLRSGNISRSGINNVFIGYESGHDNHDGSYNTFLGSLSGRSNTSGMINTFIGRRAGNSNTTGSENTYVGQGAGINSETGSFNTFLGRLAGAYNLSGDSNVFIGYLAGYYDTTSQSLIISNSPTSSPLIFGKFDEKYLRFNAGRLEIRNPQENTILGDSAGILTQGLRNVFIGFKSGYNNLYGNDNIFIGDSTGSENTSGSGNVFVGNWAGWLNTTAGNNVFIGGGAGMKNTIGEGNVFLGTTSGFNNDSGVENVFIGMSAGASNTTGSYNTFIGRRTGFINQAGDSSVFIGYRAGSQETLSNKLYIANSGTADPLIYGDFKEKSLKLNADYAEATGIFKAYGEVRTDAGYAVEDSPGVFDTINTITSVSFSQNKLKYRSVLIRGGIIVYMSEESAWLDTIGDYMIPCGNISLIGEFNEWNGDLPMRRNAINDSLWTAVLKITILDDLSSPTDSIIEVKFREDADWAVSWGTTSFPSGYGTNQNGLNIPVPLDDAGDTTIYFVTFNCKTGYYFFENLTGFCDDSLTDARDGKKYATVLIGNQCWMAQDLNVGTRIDGDADQTDNSQIEKYCYDNLESNCSLWGGLYQWPELMQYSTSPGIQGLCPAGWHIPTDDEFKTLEGNLDTHYGPDDPAWDGTGWRGADAGQRLRAATGWTGSFAGTDNHRFHAVPGGYMVDYNVFNDGGGCLQYQSSSSDSYGTPVIRHINGDFIQVMRNMNDPSDGCSVRCVKDK